MIETHAAPLAKKARQAKWRANNPQKVWAHVALRSAIKRGLVKASPCEVCGAEPAEAHHPDYDRPMHVHWLCRRHHKAEHIRECEGCAS